MSMVEMEEVLATYWASRWGKTLACEQQHGQTALPGCLMPLIVTHMWPSFCPHVNHSPTQEVDKANYGLLH